MQIGVVASFQKLGIILENKGISKLMSSKNVNNKKCAPKFIFFNEKKNQKDSNDFWHRKLTLKVKFWHFLTPSYTLVKSSRIYTGQYTFPILLLNDDNMLGEHKGREKNIAYGRLF